MISLSGSNFTEFENLIDRVHSDLYVLNAVYNSLGDDPANNPDFGLCNGIIDDYLSILFNDVTNLENLFDCIHQGKEYSRT